MDGFYGLVAGHIEDGESATQAMIREAYEEAGLILVPEDLKVVHVLHCKTNRLNLALFFDCTKEAIPVNREPEKCSQLQFFPLNNLPMNIIPHIAEVLKNVAKGEFYSESGWHDPT